MRGELDTPVEHFNNLFFLPQEVLKSQEEFTLSCSFSVDEVDLHQYQKAEGFSAFDLNRLIWKNQWADSFSPEFLARNFVIVDFDSAERFILEVTIVISITVVLTVAAFLYWDSSIRKYFEADLHIKKAI